MRKNGHTRGASRTMWPTVLVFCWGFTLLCTARSGAQQLLSEVAFDVTKLSEEKRKRIEPLQETMRDYLDNSRWIDDPLDFEVPFTLTMALEDRSTTYEDRYGAQLQVTNNRDIQYADKYCHFPYQMNDALFRDDYNYDPLTGLIDFYVYMIMGEEMDKRAILGGTAFYEKASNVCQNASFGLSEFYRGWDMRKELVEKILADKNETFRKLQAIFFRAKVLYERGDATKAKRYCRTVILELGKMFDANPQDERLKDFFRYHYFEIGDLFNDEKDNAFFERLIELDPEHREEYEKHID